jgi:UDP-N-acetylglucosamine:LPS N-acetylglucosamine transferase
MRKALVMYSRVGGGHLSAARALVAELEATGQCSAQPVDIYVDCGRFPVTRFPSIYARMARSHPHLWSLVYYGSSTSQKLKPNWVVGPFLRRQVKALFQAERPDVIIGVLPAINEVLVSAAQPVGARLEVVLTDWHSVHPFWCAPGVDHYTASTDSARADCLRFGATPDAVDVVGIPVRREFALLGPDSRHELLTRVGLDPARFTILAMVGAEGSPRAMANLAALTRSGLDAQLVVVCGYSRSLRARIEALPSRMPLRALGFVEDISGLMRSADLLVTKAGGLTLAEAFCCGMPVVVHDVLPGQEAGNLEYVLERGAVAYAPTPAALAHTIAELFSDQDRRQRLAECGARLARPDAARVIAANILGRLV